jgi:hypothetical protein
MIIWEDAWKGSCPELIQPWLDKRWNNLRWHFQLRAYEGV